MPKLAKKLPSLRHHRPSGRAVVTLNGRDHYLGPWGAPESRAEYDRLICEWLASGRGAPKAPDAAAPSLPTVSEVLLAYLGHAARHYRDPDGVPTDELDNVKDALRPVRRLYGPSPARSFGPLALRAVRDSMVRAGLARPTVNARVNRVRRVFRWAASVELIPAAVAESLRTVDGLREGRTEAPEPAPVEPVPLGHVEATLPHLNPRVAAMVRLQLLTGMRAGEVMAMRGADIARAGDVWQYRPARHKGSWRGRGRVVPLGPKAQAIVGEFLKADPDAYLFDPRDAAPGRRIAPRYDRRSYRQAIVRACDRAFPVPEGADPKAWRSAHRWSPLRLRHTAATAIRAAFGLEAAQVVLGHARADTTQIYAERDLAKAVQVMREVG